MAQQQSADSASSSSNSNSNSKSNSFLNNLDEGPKRIIKATKSYQAQNSTELSFNEGDFFWLTSNIDQNTPEFFEAYNPLTSAKGLVPSSHFEILNQKKRPESYNMMQKNNSFIISNLHLSTSPTPSNNERFSSSSHRKSSTLTNASNSNKIQAPSQVLYGLVMYDFDARPNSDELNVSKGEYLILCAHYDYEWFIAKLVNRLGGPGLVPVSYVQTLDLKTKKVNQTDDTVKQIKDSGLPTVDEWKNRTNEYKNSSINLEEYNKSLVPQYDQREFFKQHKTLYEYDDDGNNSSNNSTHSNSVSTNTLLDNNDPNKDLKLATSSANLNKLVEGSNTSQQPPPTFEQNSPDASVGIPLSTTGTNNLDRDSLFTTNTHITDVKVDNFYYQKYDENSGRYWYHVIAKLSNNKIRSLARYYDDFYEFHMDLKKEFPVEAGESKDSSQERIIPFISAPRSNINAKLAKERMDELNQYLNTLIMLPDNISKSEWTLHFFRLKPEMDKEFDENDPLVELPFVSGFNELGQNKILEEERKEAEQSTANHSSADVDQEKDVSNGDATLVSKTNSSVDPLNDANTTVLTNVAPEEKITGDLQQKIESLAFDDRVMAPVAGATVPPAVPLKNVKIKFFYEDDIFAISVPNNTTLLNLKMKIAKRVSHKLERIKLFTKTDNTEVDKDDILKLLLKKDSRLKMIIIIEDGYDDSFEDSEKI